MVKEVRKARQLFEWLSGYGKFFVCLLVGLFVSYSRRWVIGTRGSQHVRDQPINLNLREPGEDWD